MSVDLVYKEIMYQSAVEADSLSDYLKRYYKPRRIGDPRSLLRAYQNQLDALGYVTTSYHDNVTGRTIAWFPPNKKIKGEICPFS